MSYQVLARKWRPQCFEEVVGQRPVTQTLRNALVSKRLAQAFLFAGPRGVGKTTTARILARALSCTKGPTPDPCGVCDACVEIAEGRDIDVLEIDAATHTQVEKVRDIVIAGLGMAPVRNRYKIFIIDEVHRLSPQAFDALLKSIEEPPAHVIFMMATTEIDRVPETILSRAQVFELKTIGTRAITEQLRRIADAERIDVDDAALGLVARSAEGSMRDAQSAFDQVIAFAGQKVTVEDVSTVLGLVGRDLVFAMADAVAGEEPARAFEAAGRAVEAGYDLRLVCRELTRLVRDLLVVSIDPARAEDPEIASDAERPALVELARRFSREDLMRAFDVLARAESEIRAAAQPRYHLEMALLRWIHLRRLLPLGEIIERLGQAPISSGAGARPPVAPPTRPTVASPRAPTGSAAKPSDPPPVVTAPPGPPSGEPNDMKQALLAELQQAKKFFYSTVVAQAQAIESTGDRITFTFAASDRALKLQLEQSRPWIEAMAAGIAGRKIVIAAAQADGVPEQSPPDAQQAAQDDLRQKALADNAVQAMLSVFPADIKDVEELE